MSRLYNILNGIITPFGKELWTGTWSSGSITVPDTAKYSVFMATLGGEPVIVLKDGSMFRAFSIAANTTGDRQYTRTALGTISGNLWTLTYAGQMGHISGSNHANHSTQSITKIIGLIPNWGGVRRLLGYLFIREEVVA